MNILILAQEISLDQPGGSGRVVWEQARSLAARDHTVAVAVPIARHGLKREEKQSDVTIFRFGNIKRRQLFGRSIADIVDTPSFIRQTIETARWDALIIHHPHVGYGAMRVHAARKIPMMYIFHASVAAEVMYEGLSRQGINPWMASFLKPIFVQWTRWIERRILHRAHAIGVFSGFSGNLLRKLYGRTVKGKKIVRLPMGVDIKKFHIPRSRESVRRRLGVDTDAIVFLTVRRLVPRMGVRILIEAFRIVYDRLGSSVRLFIVGEGRDRALLERHVESIGLTKVVHFVGRVNEEELTLWYQAADVCVVPTIAYEGFGITIIESMASGTPVIGTPVGGIPEILLVFDERLLADAAKPLPLADRMVWFFEEGARGGWGEYTRDFVKRFYLWSKHADKVEEVLKEFVKIKK